MLRIQKTIENIIKKHGEEGKNTLDYFYNAEDFYLKIKKESFLDFVIEKHNDTVYVGFYNKINGDLVSDPVFVFHVINNENHELFIMRVEQILGDTTCGFIEGEKLKYYPSKYNDVKSFSVLCAKEWKEYYL